MSWKMNPNMTYHVYLYVYHINENTIHTYLHLLVLTVVLEPVVLRPKICYGSCP